MTEERFRNESMKYLNFVKCLLADYHDRTVFEYYRQILNNLDHKQLKFLFTVIDDMEHLRKDSLAPSKKTELIRKEAMNPYIVNFNESKKITTVKWGDGTITQVRCMENDIWDPEKALAMCFMKKWCCFNDSAKFHKIFKNYIPKEEDIEINAVDAINRLSAALNKFNSFTYTKTEDENNGR